MFEEEAIRAWVREHEVCPMTGKKLSQGQIKQAFIREEIIQSRLMEAKVEFLKKRVEELKEKKRKRD